MIILRCRACNGTGEVTNEQYRICQALKSHAAKRYFHYPMEEVLETRTSSRNMMPAMVSRRKWTAPSARGQVRYPLRRMTGN